MADPVTRHDAVFRSRSLNLSESERLLLGFCELEVSSLSEHVKARFYERNWLFRKIVDLVVDTALKDGFDAADTGTAKPEKGAKPLDAKPVVKTDAALPAPAKPPAKSPAPGQPPGPEAPPDAAESDLYKEFLDETFTDVFPDGMFHRGCKLARVHGGAGIMIGAATPPDQPFEPGQEVFWFDVATRHQLTVGEVVEDANDPRFGLPETFELRGHPRGPLTLHWTKVIILPGVARGSIPEDKQERPWTLSVLGPILASLLRYAKSMNGITEALDAFDVGVLTSPFLENALATENREEIDARQQLWNDGRKNARTMMLMLGETYERPAMTLGGVSDTFDIIVQDLTAASGNPRTLLFGSSATGLNATGEGDDKNWRDQVKIYQTQITPALSRYMTALTGKEIKVQFAAQSGTPTISSQAPAGVIPGKGPAALVTKDQLK